MVPVRICRRPTGGGAGASTAKAYAFMNSGEPGRPGSAVRLNPGRRKQKPGVTVPINKLLNVFKRQVCHGHDPMCSRRTSLVRRVLIPREGAAQQTTHSS